MFNELKITVCANPKELEDAAELGNFDLTGTTLCDQVPVGQRSDMKRFQQWRFEQSQPVHLIIDLEVQLLETLVAVIPARSLTRLDDFLWRSGWFIGMTTVASEIKLYYRGSWYIIKQRYKEL